MTVLLTAENLCKSYGGVRAVNDVSLNVTLNEVIAIVGDNGAGKSTLTKIFAGAVRPDSGSLSFENRRVAFHSPKDARRLGLEMLQQDLALVADFDATENLFFGRELSSCRFPAQQQNAYHHARRVNPTRSVSDGL